MSSIFDAIFRQALLAVVGYALVGWALFRALVNTFALRQFRRGIDAGAKQIAEKLMSPNTGTQPWLEITHPAAKVLARLEQHSVSERELTRLVDFEIARCFSSLLAAMEKNQVQAQFFGLCGTLTGYPLAAEQFRQSRDVVDAFGAISMAIWTTVIGTVVAQWEDGHVRTLNALRQDVTFETWNFLSTYVRGNPGDTAPAAIQPPVSTPTPQVEVQLSAEAATSVIV